LFAVLLFFPELFLFLFLFLFLVELRLISKSSAKRADNLVEPVILSSSFTYRAKLAQPTLSLGVRGGLPVTANLTEIRLAKSPEKLLSVYSACLFKLVKIISKAKVSARFLVFLSGQTVLIVLITSLF
jgi:hypothetical protein